MALAAFGLTACGTQGAHDSGTMLSPMAARAAHAAATRDRAAAARLRYAPPPSPPCSQMFASTAAAAAALKTAGAGTAICLSPGGYGPLALAGRHAGTVTIEPVPGTAARVQGVTVAPGASGIAIHDLAISGGVTLQAGDTHIAVDHDDIDGEGPGGQGEGVQAISVNCAAPNAPSYPGCASTPPDSDIAIVGNRIHGYGRGHSEDAIHLNNWEDVTIADNDIYDLEEHGNHTDAMQSVFGGHHMLFERNYEHDNQAQGFFVNDGDAAEVTVNDNLFLRNDNEPRLYPGGEYNIQVFDTTGLTITNNTVWDGQQDILRAEGASETPTATVSHNLERSLNVLHAGGGPAYRVNSHDNVFAEAPWSIRPGAGSVVVPKPRFVDPAAGDYRLRGGRPRAGVDWQPSEYLYGPTGY
ncbi:MAG TPA: right-handed parallel beta-helix repeat-containing protein [Solirubrobacteraceae bacterium]|nr:right-handed parallel beta-helix repeat-containing protein [Solirubrobacteraceae bacterium]